MTIAGSLEIRDFKPEDYDTMAAILHSIYPDDQLSPSELRYRDEAFDPNKYVLKRYSAVETGHGHIVAYADFRHTPDMFHPRKFWIGVNIDPAWQRKGIGTMLYERIMLDVAEMDAITVRAGAREDKRESVSFLKKRGFEERLRSWESHLQLHGFDFAKFQGYPGKMSKQGITISTLRESSHEDPQCYRKLYELLMTVAADMPAPDTFTPLAFEDFKKHVVLNPDCLQDGYLIARDGERYVGLSNVFKGEKERDTLFQQDTGVLREYRRRGIAMALKLEVVKFAKDYGASLIKTWNDSTNTGMLAVNQKLGFRRQIGWITFEKNLQR